MYKIINSNYPKIFEFFVNYLIDRQIKNDYIPNNYKFFKSYEEILQWGDNYYEYFETLEQEYNKSFFSNRELLPFSVFSWYTGYFFEKINGYLRGQIRYDNSLFITGRIKIIKRELDNFKLKENIVVVRRVSNIFLNNYILDKKKLKIGAKMKDGAFLSTSIDLSYRKDKEGTYKPLNNETLIFIKVSRLTKAIYLEPISKRQEFELMLSNDIEIVIENFFKILTNKIIFAKTVN